ncbi:hypothetical protein DEO72_LG5g2131 [Vigna unguiculata]|uniref:Uncharacterized protein n=1 Tax=Vigna unguiculata TaxID=3917 RepID=A0A4D6LZY7_VIGUN|nr:hypothetical protein DEO72_LG5g2131 [Vigna unguiculata]
MDVLNSLYISKSQSLVLIYQYGGSDVCCFAFLCRGRVSSQGAVLSFVVVVSQRRSSVFHSPPSSTTAAHSSPPLEIELVVIEARDLIVVDLRGTSVEGELWELEAEDEG